MCAYMCVQYVCMHMYKHTQPKTMFYNKDAEGDVSVTLFRSRVLFPPFFPAQNVRYFVNDKSVDVRA